VRVNAGRIQADYRLAVGDRVRIPPLRLAEGTQQMPHLPTAHFPILFEDEYLLVIDKPAGVAVHGGSGVSYGVIEQLRQTRQPAERAVPFLELAHRLDRETSGILILAKKRSALLSVHRQLRESQIDKRYMACVLAPEHSIWASKDGSARQIVKAPLFKYLTGAGERRVRVQEDGQRAHTVFTLLKRYQEGYALLEAQLKTGRTHQIRVHFAHLGTPIVGDDKYGDFALNRELARPNAQPALKRMFLHACRITLMHPATGAPLTLTAPLPLECERFLQQLEKG
jgi:23S rRNA pseudouridine955/2504/2580 synthase